MDNDDINYRHQQIDKATDDWLKWHKAMGSIRQLPPSAPPISWWQRIINKIKGIP